MKKNIIFLIFIYTLFLFTISCKSNGLQDKKTIKIEQLSTNYPVTLLKDKENNQVFRIFFRIPFKISNDTHQIYTISNVRYYYSNKYGKSYLSITNSGWLDGLLIYNSKTNKRITYNYPEFKNDNPAYIYIYTAHDLDTISQVQLELKPYINKMIELGQDTLSIPSFNEFKKEHPQLVKKLLQGDSISVFVEELPIQKNNLEGDTTIKTAIKY